MNVLKATLTFFDRQSWPPNQRPYELLFQPPEKDFPVSNYKIVEVPDVPIHDMRPLKEELSLDLQGFFFAGLETAMDYEDYFDQNMLKSKYIPEIKTFLKVKLGVRASYIHECVIRQADRKKGYSSNFGQPIPNVHTDYTHEYAMELPEQLIGDKVQAEMVKESRIQMLNLWKPLRGPLRSWPLGLCDLRSLKRDDVVPFDEVHATAVLHSQQVIYNESQKWYYLSDQEATEILVFKSMDSAIQGEVAHGSFFDPTCPDSEPPRESIELRILTVY